MLTIKKLYDIAGGPQAVTGFHSSYPMWLGSPTSAFVSGVEDMQINGAWTPGILQIMAPHRHYAYTWAPVPTSHKGWKFQTLMSHNALIPRGAKHVSDGFRVIEFLVSDTAEQIVFDHTAWMGPRFFSLPTAQLSRDLTKYAGLSFYLTSWHHNDKLWGIPSNPIEAYTATQWNTALQDVLYGKMTPQDALKQLQQTVTAQMHQQFPNG
jgi:ABC-type glycerol-3-phosphate transport system substrate-binding protein